MAPVLVWITAYLDLDGRATDTRRLPRPYQAKDSLNRLRFLSNSGLALIVGQTVQAAGVEIDSQWQSYSAPYEQNASQSGNPILLERAHQRRRFLLRRTNSTAFHSKADWPVKAAAARSSRRAEKRPLFVRRRP
jgi:hypothetical protein